MKFLNLAKLIIVSLLFACSSNTDKNTIDRYAHIKDIKAQEIIKRSIEDAGGIQQWEAIQTIRYKKNFTLLTENGEIEKTFKQDHNYTLPSNEYIIRSEENEDILFTTGIDDQYARNKNGEDLEVDPESLRKSINSSVYVLGIPFKLLDTGADIKYLGEQELNGSNVDVIQVGYNPDLHKNHSSKNLWKFYFDKDNSRIIANWIESADHYNIVENIEFIRVKGLLLHSKRKSYRVNELGKKLYLRADYHYFDYSVEY